VGDPPTVLLGRARIESAPDAPVPVVLLAIDSDAFDHISACDWPAPARPSTLALACTALWKAGMRLADIAQHLSLDVGASVIQRYIAAERCGGDVLTLLDAGVVTWGHVRLIQNLPDEQRSRVVDQIATDVKKPSVRALQKSLSGTPSPAPTPELSAELLRYEKTLRNAVQADNLCLFKTTAGGYRLEIKWSQVPVLQGILEKIGAAPNVHELSALPSRPRSLVFEVDSNDELDALMGHLVIDF